MGNSNSQEEDGVIDGGEAQVSSHRVFHSDISFSAPLDHSRKSSSDSGSSSIGGGGVGRGSDEGDVGVAEENSSSNSQPSELTVR